MTHTSRRDFLGATVTTAAALALPRATLGAVALADVQSEIVKRHAEGVQRLQEWVRQPSIAAENRGMAEGCELMMRLAREAGFQAVTRVPTDGQPAIVDKPPFGKVRPSTSCWSRRARRRSARRTFARWCNGPR